MSSSVKNLGGGGNSSGTTLNLEYLCDSQKYGNSSIGYETWVAFEDLQRDRYDEYIVIPQGSSWGPYTGEIGLLAVPTTMSTSSKGALGVSVIVTNYRGSVAPYELTYSSRGGVVGLSMDGDLPFKVYGVVKEE